MRRDDKDGNDSTSVPLPPRTVAESRPAADRPEIHPADHQDAPQRASGYFSISPGRTQDRVDKLIAYYCDETQYKDEIDYNVQALGARDHARAATRCVEKNFGLAVLMTLKNLLEDSQTMQISLYGRSFGIQARSQVVIDGPECSRLHAMRLEQCDMHNELSLSMLIDLGGAGGVCVEYYADQAHKDLLGTTRMSTIAEAAQAEPATRVQAPATQKPLELYGLEKFGFLPFFAVNLENNPSSEFSSLKIN